MDVCAYIFLTKFPVHTDDHASTDITELGFLAVVVLELVGFVVDPQSWVGRRFRFLLLHFHLLLIYEIDLETQKTYLRQSLKKTRTMHGYCFNAAPEALPPEEKKYDDVD